MPRLALGLPAAVLAAAAMVAGCGSGHDKSRTGPPPAPGAAIGPGTVQVKIDAGRFDPDSVEVKVGQIVTWTNRDRVAHSVTARSGATFASRRLGPGETYTYTATAPGTIVYGSAGRPDMTATIKVAK